MLMPIGRFAKASRLTVKSLRNYDESGLLPAAFVDPESGYRYYRLEQLARADAVRSLRMVEMPLAMIAETLDGESPERSLMSHLDSLNEQRAELDRKAQQLQRLIATKEYVMSTEVTIKNSPVQTVAAVRTTTTYDKIFGDIPAGFGQVMGFLGGANIDPIGAPFTLFYQAPDGDNEGDIALCVPVASPIEDGGDVTTIELSAGPMASIIHKGSYDDMGESYATVATWVHEHGHQITGPAREIYFNSPDEVAEADLVTEILFPIDSEGGA